VVRGAAVLSASLVSVWETRQGGNAGGVSFRTAGEFGLIWRKGLKSAHSEFSPECSPEVNEDKKGKIGRRPYNAHLGPASSLSKEGGTGGPENGGELAFADCRKKVLLQTGSERGETGSQRGHFGLKKFVTSRSHGSRA